MSYEGPVPENSPFSSCRFGYLKKIERAVAGVAQWIEFQPVNQKVASSIPSQGSCLGCGPGSRVGACERQPH